MLSLLHGHADVVMEAKGGVDALRKAILKAAMRGDLSSTGENDTPVAALLDTIRSERKALEASTTIRRQKRLPKVSAFEYSSVVPSTWQWVRLAEVGIWGSGGTPKKSELNYYGGDIPWLVIGDLNEDRVTAAATYITREGLDNSSAVLLEPDTLLIAMYGSIGKLGITDFECATNQAIAFCKPFSGINLRFLFWFIRSIREDLTGEGKGLAQKNISQTILKNVPIALPPPEEQHRIANKIDALMAHCDEFQRQTERRETTRSHLAEASYHALTSASTPEEFRDSWQRIADNFEHFTASQDELTRLRQTVIDLGLTGRYTSRLGDVVLETRAPTPSNHSFGNETSWQVPSNWDVVQLGIVAEHRLGKMLDRRKNTGKPRPYLRNTNIQWDRLDLSDIKEIQIEEEEVDEFRLQSGDVLVCEGGEPGRAAIWGGHAEDMVFQKALHRIRPSERLHPRFLLYRLMTDASSGRLAQYFTGATIKHLTGKNLARYTLPLPPITEQRKIVALLDNLLAHIGELSLALGRSAEAGERLTHSITEITHRTRR